MPKLREEYLTDHARGMGVPMNAQNESDYAAAQAKAAQTTIVLGKPVPPVGRKFDTGKAPVFQGFESYFPLAIIAVANVSKYGAEKYSVAYSDKNWKRVDSADARYKDGEGRHKLLPETTEGLYDAESHLLHAAHKAWNSMATLQLLLEAGTPLRDPAAS